MIQRKRDCPICKKETWHTVSFVGTNGVKLVCPGCGNTAHENLKPEPKRQTNGGLGDMTLRKRRMLHNY